MTAPKSPDFIPSLESVRGLAAMSVLLIHACSVLGGEPPWSTLFRTFPEVQSSDELFRRMIFVVFNGNAAVSMFFVLSGFVLALSLRRDGRLAVFTARRLLRIYPALAVNIVLMTLVLWLLVWIFPNVPFKNPTVSQLWANVALVGFDINEPTWTLLVELLAIPLIVVCHLIALRFGLRGLLVMLAFGVIALIWGQDAERALQAGGMFSLIFGLHVVDYQFMFTVGMLAAEWHSRRSLNIRPGAAVVGLIVAVAMVLNARAVFGFFDKWALLVEGFGSAAVVLLLAAGPRTSAHQLLEWHPIRFLGRVSYSLYLYHATTLAIIKPVVLWAMTDAGIKASPYFAASITVVAGVLTTIPLAWAAYVYVERPAIQYSARRFQKAPVAFPRSSFVAHADRECTG
jgi:peptidoglycan/LPS O-acetylase OafA/YrhL